MTEHDEEQITFPKKAWDDFLVGIAQSNLLTPTLGELVNRLCEEEVQ